MPRRASVATSPALRRDGSVGPGSPYEVLKHAILDGEYSPGHPLVEAVLAQRLAVSRTPVREALSRLEQDGLAQRTSSGLAVREHTPEQVLDIYHTRYVLEGLAAEVAAERRTELDVRNIDAALRANERLDASDPRAMAVHNRDFHRAIWRASHNDTINDLLERIVLHLCHYPETTLTYPGRWEESLIEHRALANAIRLRDGESASRVAVQHFKTAREIRLKLWYGEPDE